MGNLLYFIAVILLVGWAIGFFAFAVGGVNKAADCILNLLSDSVLSKNIVTDAFNDFENISWDISAKKIANADSSSRFLKYMPRTILSYCL